MVGEGFGAEKALHRYGSRGSRAMRTYLQTLRRRKALIVLIAVIMPVVAYIATQGRPDRYRSSTQVLLQPGSSVDELVNGTTPSNSDPVAQERFLQTQADLGQVPAVAETGLARAHVTGITPNRLLEDVEVKPKPNADLLVISVTAATPALARRLTTGFAEAFADRANAAQSAMLAQAVHDVQASIDRQLANQRRLRARAIARGDKGPLPPLRNGVYNRLTRTREQLVSAAAVRPEKASVVRPASKPEHVAPRPLRNAALAFALAVLFALALALLLETIDTRIRTTEELVRELRLPLLARIPFPRSGRRRTGQVVMRTDPESPMSRGVRRLEASLGLAAADRFTPIVLLTSPGPKEGTSALVANLGVAYAQAGREVVVIDGNLRGPSLHNYLGLPAGLGLSDVVAGESSLAEVLLPVPFEPVDNLPVPSVSPTVEAGRLRMIRAGIAELPAERVLGDPGFREMLSRLREAVDIVLIDTPPLIDCYDALTLSPSVTGVVVVARVGGVGRPALLEFTRLLAMTPRPKLGVVATGVRRNDVDRYEAPSHVSAPVEPTQPDSVTINRA
jgi:Mrp family chromosome partitioning ATPase/capsular polysaccharide biosynthesis protein